VTYPRSATGWPASTAAPIGYPNRSTTQWRAAAADELDRSTLYRIDPDFTDLATHAAAQLPDTTAGTTHPPATSGLLIWARPVPAHDLKGASSASGSVARADAMLGRLSSWWFARWRL
jgi:hypothetical protein